MNKHLRKLLTFRLAHALYKSLPRHPMFWNEITASMPPSNFTFRQRMLRAAIVILIFISTLPLIFAFLMSGFLVVLLGGTLAGLHTANGVSGAIGSQREQSRYDLIAVSPDGAFGMSWALAARFLRMKRGSLRLRRLILFGYMTIAVMLLFAVLLLPFSTYTFLSVATLVSTPGYGGVPISATPVPGSAAPMPNSATPVPNFDWGESIPFLNARLLTVLNLFLLLAFVRLDYTQSVITGALIGMLAPTLTRRRVDASIMAFGLFLGLQFAVYLVIFLFDFNMLGALFTNLGLNGIISSLTQLAIALIIRESALTVLWQIVESELNTTLPELDRFAGVVTKSGARRPIS